MSSSKFAIVNVFGRQFKVAEGDKIHANFVDAKAGEKITFSEVFMLNNGNDLKVGAPVVQGASVTAEVVSSGREDKIIVFKYLRKNKSKKMRGHRQPFTTLSITSIVG
jgi:large subunit ribosomal protein L21